MINIETDRLIIRNFKIEDVDDFHEYMSSETVAKYDDFEPFTYEESVKSIKRRVEIDIDVAIVLKDINKVIGDVNFSEDEEYKGTYEIGYDLNEKFWKKGYATEACTAIIDYILNELGGRRVYALCNDDNYNSINLLERLGMRREGHFIEDDAFKKDSNGNVIYVSTYLYAILKREWKNN